MQSENHHSAGWVAARDRRLLYQQRALYTAMPEDPSSQNTDTEHSRLLTPSPRMTRAATTIETTSTTSRENSLPEASTSRTYSLPEAEELEAVAAAGCTAPKSAIRCKRTRFNTTRSVSIVEPAVTMEEPKSRRSSAEGKEHRISAHGYTAPRSPTTPSNILTKVKERIREKVFMSSEWPNSAVMMQEKRQRANDALNASLHTRRELDQVQLQIHTKKKGRSKTEGARYEVIERNPNITNKSEVRQSFIRRRSISEDTYDRGLLMQMKSDILESSDVPPTEHKSSLPFGARLRRSPRPVKKHMRTQSLDSGKTGMCRTYIEPAAFISCGSSASTLSSARTLDSVASGSSNSVRYEYTDLQHYTQILPEIVLDKNAKETILEESGEYEIDEQGRKRPKPIPEVVFDENGQTWDVYGADFDPEILGHAIQRHLERLMSTQSEDDEVPIYQEQDEVHDSARSTQPSFWLRLLCMFTNKETVSS